MTYFILDVEFRRCMGKTIFSSSTEAYFSHVVITARRLVRVGLKNEPVHGGGSRANGYAARHNRSGVWLYNHLLCHATPISSKEATEA